VPEDEQATLIGEEPVALHLVDQGGHERTGCTDEVGEVLLRDAVQAKLVSGSDPLAVRLGERDEHLRESGRNVLEGEAKDALPHLTDAIVERADDVDGERRAGLEQRPEVAALDAPDLALARADGELLHQGAFRPQHLAEEIARLENGQDRAALALPLAEQPDAPRAEEEHLVRRHSRPVDDRAMRERLDLEVAAEVDDIGRRQAGRGERGLELEAGIDALLARDHEGSSGYCVGVAPLPEHQACQLTNAGNRRTIKQLTGVPAAVDAL